jgi:hypothetical protein
MFRKWNEEIGTASARLELRTSLSFRWAAHPLQYSEDLGTNKVEPNGLRNGHRWVPVNLQRYCF